ncbi:MAG: peptidoglycan DD-metalloendopeptidase family protein, partial [Chloroflexota bacterium]
MAACNQAPVESEPVVVPTLALAVLQPTELPTPTPTSTATPNLPQTLTTLPTPTATIPGTPTPIQSGGVVDPAQFNATPRSLGGDASELDLGLTDFETRPPPLPVPLAIHPEDHYWLARPIPSGSRNYDLPWYPFGNDVLIPALAPYRVHHGVDFPNPPGAAVLAAGDGTVIWAGPRPSPRNGINYYGNTIIIEHDWQWRSQPVYTLYAHTLEMFVQVGDRVQQGQLLAGVGGSGQVSGTHLHFEVRVGGNGYFNTRNPALWLPPYEGWGTLAGRMIDRLGEPIPGADLTIIPLETFEETFIRRQKTYVDPRLPSDEVWQENFVVADLPAGRYRVEAEVIPEPGLLQTYTNEISILTGQTNFLLI